MRVILKRSIFDVAKITHYLKKSISMTTAITYSITVITLACQSLTKITPVD